MKELLLFGGTSEAHLLLSALTHLPVAVTVCVATEYGRALLPEQSDRLRVLAGRKDAAEIFRLLGTGRFSAVIDATHPYAVEVTRALRDSAARTGTAYLRLLRRESNIGSGILVPDMAAAAELVCAMPGPALLTTGSKELGPFTSVPDFARRLYVRVLPSVEVIRSCLSLGFAPGRIIAMQGPFSKELNLALLRQFSIRTLVTKDGGKEGGFPEKLAAAEEVGAQMIVVRRPREEGLGREEVLARLTGLLEEER